MDREIEKGNPLMLVLIGTLKANICFCATAWQLIHTDTPEIPGFKPAVLFT